MKLHHLHESAQSDADLLMLLFSTLAEGKLKKGKLLTILEDMDNDQRTAILEQAINFARVPQGTSMLNDFAVAMRSLETVKDVLERLSHRIDDAKPTMTHPLIKELNQVFALSISISAKSEDLSTINMVTQRLEMYIDELQHGDIKDTLKIDDTDVAFIEATFKKLRLI